MLVSFCYDDQCITLYQKDIRELFGRKILNNIKTLTAIATLIPNCVAMPVKESCESSVLVLLVLELDELILSYI